MTETEAEIIYHQLPDGIKQAYSFKEWLWLSDEQKRNLTFTETRPDHVE